MREEKLFTILQDKAISILIEIDIDTADQHTAEYHHMFIWTMVAKHQTKLKKMLNDVFVLFYSHKSPNHAFKRI